MPARQKESQSVDPYLTNNLADLNWALTNNRLFLADIIVQKLIKSGYDLQGMQLKLL